MIRTPLSTKPNGQIEPQSQTAVSRLPSAPPFTPVEAYASELEQQLEALQQTLEQVQRSEARYRHFVEGHIEPICCFQPDFTLTFVNPAYSVLFGKHPTEMVGESILDRIPVEYHAPIFALSSLSLTHPVVTSEHPLQLAGGGLRWFQWTNRLIADETGRTVEYQSVGRDVTKRRQAEEAAREQRRFAEALRDSLAALTGSMDVDTMMQQILASAAIVVPSQAGSIILFEENQGRVAYCRGFTPEAEAFFQNHRFALHELTPEGVSTNARAYLVLDTHAWTNWVSLPVSAWIRSSIGVPIAIRGQTIGLLVLDSATANHFQLADVEKLQAFAQYASLALENAYHVKWLEDRVAVRTEELQVAKEQVEAILNNSPDALLLVHPNLRIKQTNAVFNKLFGDLPDHSLLDLIHPDDATAVTALVQAVSNQQAGYQIEIRACRQDSVYFDAELSVGPVKEAGLVCILRDVTERKRAQTALAEERNLLRTMIDAMPDMIYVKDLQHRFVLCNAAAGHALHNQEPETLIGRTDFDFFPPMLAEQFRAEEEEIFRTGESVIRHEKQVVDWEGKSVWISTTKVLLRNLQGDLIGLAGFSHDITERYRNEEALRASEEKFRQLVETMGSGLIIYDLNAGVTYVNERFCDLMGYTREEILGAKSDAGLDVMTIQRVDYQLTSRSHGESNTYELVLKRKDGQEAYCLVSGSPLYDHQRQVIGSFAVVTDITLQKRAAEALQEALQKEKELSELKSRFVSMASHEFRTPLTSILLMTDTLRAYRHKLTDEKIEQRLTNIREQVEYLKIIIEDVLELARIQAGRLEFNPAPLDVDLLCRSVVDEFQQQPQSIPRLVYHCDEGVPRMNLDKRLMRQVLTNLVANATKYSPVEESVFVTLAYTGAALVLQVRDEGIGIPEADLKHLFQPFYRATNVGAVPGTGLGLMITKEAIDLHGGVITVESQVGVGTTFTITIPQPEI